MSLRLYEVFLENQPFPRVDNNISEHSRELVILGHNLPHIILFIFGSCIIGALFRSLEKKVKLPYTVLVSMFGIILGSIKYDEVKQYTKQMANIDPVLLIHAFMPVLIFSTAFEIESHIFWKSLLQVALLSVPGFLINCTLTAVLAVKVYTYNWDWYTAMMFAAIVSPTDPIISVSLLRNIGSAKALTLLIEGESLFNDGTSIIMFEIFRDLAIDPYDIIASELAIKLVLKIFVSPLFGFLMSKVVMFWLSYIFNDGLIEITMSLAMTYITFYIGEIFSEWLGMSGVISVTMLGLLLDTVNFSPEIEVFLLRFWEMLTYLANTLIFIIVGVVIAERSFEHLAVNDGFYIVVLYFALNIIRLVMIIVLSPLLSRIGYGFNWRWASVSIWSGIRGAFSLNLALMAFQSEGLDKVTVKNKILLHTSGMVVLTLLINATTMTWLLKLLGLCDISAPKRMAMYSAVQRVRDSEENTFSMLKMDRFLADANWNMAEKIVEIADPYKTTDEKVSVEGFSTIARTSKCPDCEKSIPCEPSPREMEDMLEEARMRILKAQKTSYWRQYSSGMLNRYAARTLISTTENITDCKGKFMTVKDVKKYWELKGVFVLLRRKLEDWMYDVKVDKLKPSKNFILKRCYQIVFSNTFEYFIYTLILLNLFPIILEYIPQQSLELDQELRFTNYIFFTSYLMEASLKALAMRRAYLFNHWNQFDLFIISMAAVDIIFDQLFGFSDLNIHMIKIVRVFRMFRLTRALRLVKIIIPRLIELLNKQINKQLSFGYDIGKGYVVGEEDISKIVDHISDEKSIAQKLRNILEKNRQEAVRELGLLQRDHPAIAISVKTRQAIRTVLNSERDTIHALMSGGLLDDNEALKLEKMIELKMKQLIKFPPAIPPPTAEELLVNVPWLEKGKLQIQFMKSRGKLLYFDYGDTIIREGDEPQGIHLVVSGMVKVHGTSPYLGTKKLALASDSAEMSRLTDYRSSGAILGDLNCLTQQRMEITVTCETATQTCFISTDTLFEAFDVFSEFPSLEYKIWHSLAVKISVSTFIENVIYQGWTYNKICAYLAHAYLVDLDMNSKFNTYDGSMEEAVLVYGSCDDTQNQKSYDAPAVISKRTGQVTSTTNLTKLFIVPNASAEVKGRSPSAQLHDGRSAPCLRHAAAHRRDSKIATRGLLQTVSGILHSLPFQGKVHFFSVPHSNKSKTYQAK
ncbi:sodium/hydrogen exchanger 10-like [Huso huso]|uniref:Sodium/hydrogen exchanger 10-like n=1 Tax=Huso huso TaxID=61971 RepID=A0ABR0YJ47_HUSHU